MLKYRLQLKNVQNVAAGKTALIDCPCGQRYHYIGLALGYAGGTNTIAAAVPEITEVRIFSNSRVQRVFSGQQLRDMNLLNCQQGSADFDVTGLPNSGDGVVFPIFFNEPWRETPADQDALGWATAGWVNFQLQVDLLSVANGGVATPFLTACAVVDDMIPAANTNPGIVKWIRMQQAAAGTKYDFGPVDRRDILTQISIYPDTGGSQPPTLVTFKKNSQTLHELTATTNTGLLINSQMSPAATGRSSGIYDLVFDHDGLISSGVTMDGARDSLLEISAASAMSGTQTAIVQRFGPPE